MRLGSASPGRHGGRPARTVAGLLALGLLIAGCSGGGSYQYRWEFFFDSIFSPDGFILSGIWLTVSIAVTSQIIGVILGVFGALGKQAKRRGIRWLANFYVWIFRGTPLLVQISLLYFGLGVAKIYTWPDINLFGFAIPGAVQAGIVALGLNEGAYMTEIVRAGIISVDPGQMEAAKSLGMTYGKAMRRIVLPQAARVIIPPLGNEFNNMLKTTSLLVIISVPELYVIFSRKQGNFFAPFEFFLACRGLVPAADDHLGRHPGLDRASPWSRRRWREATGHARAGVRSGREVDPSLVSGGR